MTFMVYVFSVNFKVQTDENYARIPATNKTEFNTTQHTT